MLNIDILYYNSNNYSPIDRYKFAIECIQDDKCMIIHKIQAIYILIANGVYREIKPTLQNENNSCYINSILVALFAMPYEYLTQKILLNDHDKPLSLTLQSIVLSMRIFNNKVLTSSDLRLKLSKYKPFNGYLKGETEDTYEFFSNLFSLFKVYTQAVEEKYKNSGKVEITETESIPSVLVNLELFIKYKVFNLNEFDFEYEQFTTDDNVRIVKIIKFKNPKFLAINILHARTLNFETKVIPSERLKTYPNLSLISIILFNKFIRHYTCVYRVVDKWYEYDDLRCSSIQLEHNICDYEHILTNSCLFFYVEC